MKVAILAKARNGHLIQYRQRFKISQTVAAKYAGVTIHVWCALECMRFKKVSARAIDKVADLLEVHPNTIAPPELRGDQIKWTETAFADLSPEHLLGLQSQALISYKELQPELCSGQGELARQLEGILRTLTHREREIIKLRYGIGDDGHIHTLKEIGKIFRVTSSRVRQVEAKAIRKLQSPTRSRKLEGFLDL